jgi:hypothetical protein
MSKEFFDKLLQEAKKTCYLCTGKKDEGGISLCGDCSPIYMAREKEKFVKEWQTASPSEKLRFYSKEKLVILCRRKAIKRYSKLSKQQLVELLKDTVTEKDFPIR